VKQQYQQRLNQITSEARTSENKVLVNIVLTLACNVGIRDVGGERINFALL